MTKRQVYLVPGFFGYESLGSLSYFMHVKEALQQRFAALNFEVEVFECATQPTGSIRRRAVRLIEEIAEDGGLQADELYFVSHSTGGLDARLMLTPAVRLCPDQREATIAAKTRSLITVAAPHFGTPLATFFTTLAGRQVLQLLTTLALSGPGRMAIFAGARLATAVARLDDRLGLKDTALDYWVDNLLAAICKNPDSDIWTFLREVASDQGAIIQLTPEGMDLFNAAVTDRPDIDYRCVVTAAPPYRARTFEEMKLGLMPGAVLFAFLYRVAAGEHAHYPYPSEASKGAPIVDAQLPFKLSPRTNDGVVPTLSQIYGRILDVAVADHMDIVGQYPNACGRPNADWLPSGSAFDERGFEAAWNTIAEDIYATATQAEPARAKAAKRGPAESPEVQSASS